MLIKMCCSNTFQHSPLFSWVQEGTLVLRAMLYSVLRTSIFLTSLSWLSQLKQLWIIIPKYFVSLTRSISSLPILKRRECFQVVSQFTYSWFRTNYHCLGISNIMVEFITLHPPLRGIRSSPSSLTRVYVSNVGELLIPLLSLLYSH